LPLLSIVCWKAKKNPDSQVRVEDKRES